MEIAGRYSKRRYTYGRPVAEIVKPNEDQCMGSCCNECVCQRNPGVYNDISAGAQAFSKRSERAAHKRRATVAECFKWQTATGSHLHRCAYILWTTTECEHCAGR